MLISWAPSGRKDILHLLNYYIEQGQKDVGQMLLDRIIKSISRLSSFPNSGREGRLKETRELILPDLPYIVVYRVKDHVEIVRILHSRKQYP